MSWPKVVLPQFFFSETEKEKSSLLLEAVQDLQSILKGKVSLIADFVEILPNADVGILEVYRAVGASNIQLLDNPLERELLGMVPVFSIEPGLAFLPKISHTDVNVTAGSKVVTLGSSPFSGSEVAKGFFIADGTSAPGTKIKIDTYDSTTQVTLVDAWPGSTETGIAGIFTYRWHTDSFYLQFNGAAPNWVRLLVF